MLCKPTKYYIIICNSVIYAQLEVIIQVMESLTSFCISWILIVLYSQKWVNATASKKILRMYKIRLVQTCSYHVFSNNIVNLFILALTKLPEGN